MIHFNSSHSPYLLIYSLLSSLRYMNWLFWIVEVISTKCLHGPHTQETASHNIVVKSHLVTCEWYFGHTAHSPHPLWPHPLSPSGI